MTNSYLQLMGQLKAQSDRLTALVENAGAAVPPTAGGTFTAAIARAMAALQALVNIPTDAAALVPQAHASIPGKEPQAAAIAAQVQRIGPQRAQAAQAAIDALDAEAATVVKALDARFSVKKPASLSDVLLVRKADQLQALFESQGGNSPALLLRAVSQRLLQALDQGDTATAYVITSELDDWRAIRGIDATSWEATIANTMQERTTDGAQNEGAAALYAALTNSRPGSLAEFCGMAGVLLRAMERYTADSSVPASMRGTW